MLKGDNFDFVIVGAGVVGALLALLLSRQKTSISVPTIAIIDPNFNVKLPMDTPLKEDEIVECWHSQSRRVSAINQTLFEQLRELLGEPLVQIAAPLTGMKVFTPECAGHFTLDAEDYGYQALACVVANDTLNALMMQQVSQCHNITLISGCADEVKQCAQGYQLGVNDQAIFCRYLVAADGAHSRVRRQCMVPKVGVGQDASAISAQIVLPQLKNTARAFQWFLNDGSVLGVLPVAGVIGLNAVYSLVWSQPHSFVGGALSQAQLQDKLCLMASQLGQPMLFQGIEVISEPQVWPLNRSYVQTKSLAQDFPGLFFIGDAAHVIHPLSGQGLNLGLRDAFELSLVFEHLKAHQKTLRSLSARYTASRFKQIQQHIRVCEGLNMFFMRDSWPLYALGAIAFRQFDRHTQLKKMIATHMSFS